MQYVIIRDPASYLQTLQNLLVIYLTTTFIIPGKRPGPAVASPYHFVKFSFKNGVDQDFWRALGDALQAQAWERPTATGIIAATASPNASPKPSVAPVNSKIRSGIVGIERSIEEHHRATDQSISVAFQDLRKLMEKAKDMVAISKNISNKIRVCKCIKSLLNCFFFFKYLSHFFVTPHYRINKVISPKTIQ